MNHRFCCSAFWFNQITVGFGSLLKFEVWTVKFRATKISSTNQTLATGSMRVMVHAFWGNGSTIQESFYNQPKQCTIVRDTP